MASGLYTYYGTGRTAIPTPAGVCNEPGSNPTTPQRGTLLNSSTAAITIGTVIWDDGVQESNVVLQPGQHLAVLVRSAASASAAGAFVVRHNNRR
jgi:hypothetical protein